MIAPGSQRQGPRLQDVLLLAVGIGGLVACVTLVFLGMRSVMDVGGTCADGGPYVSAQPCPDGSAATLLLGIFGGFGFGALAMAFGPRVGGVWTGAAILIGWSGLFASLGWNFLDYGLLNPPEGEGIVWGWLIPGLLFEAMALGPILFAVWALRGTSGGVAGTVSALGTRGPVPLPGALIVQPAESTSPTPAPGNAAADDTTGLLDRLERLADLRDRGLLGTDEFEVAKTAVMRELEARR